MTKKQRNHSQLIIQCIVIVISSVTSIIGEQKSENNTKSWVNE